MLTSSARRAATDDAACVTTDGRLVREGWSSGAIRSQFAGGRWQRVGRAVVRHNGPLTREQQELASLINAGPRSALTSFTALRRWGLDGWDREEIHVLVPRGARVTRPAALSIRVHYTDDWRPDTINQVRALHRPEHAALLAASGFAHARPACGVFAAVIQQRLVRPTALVDAVEVRSRVRHHAVLLKAAHDIAGGAQALSEIDFARLCRRALLPEPRRQTVRLDAGGRRRYLDAEWALPGGRRVVVEVDGALHLVASRWWDDQLRQNELVLAGNTVLRFPSVIVRYEQALVVDQVRRALTARRP